MFLRLSTAGEDGWAAGHKAFCTSLRFSMVLMLWLQSLLTLVGVFDIAQCIMGLAQAHAHQIQLDRKLHSGFHGGLFMGFSPVILLHFVQFFQVKYPSSPLDHCCNRTLSLFPSGLKSRWNPHTYQTRVVPPYCHLEPKWKCFQCLQHANYSYFKVYVLYIISG